MGTTQLNAIAAAPFIAAITASKTFYIILSRRPATVPRWKLHISYQAGSSVLETSTYLLVMTAWQFHMTSPWSRPLWDCLYLSPRVLSASADAEERRKADHYANNCASHGMHFIPLAQETLGGWSTQAGKILILLADRKGIQPVARPYAASSASLPSGA
jgi:hypothetical protein